MPRGQYDRSKSKAQRAAEKNADEPKSTVKKARAPYGSKKLTKVAAAGTPVYNAKESTSGKAEIVSLETLCALRGCFTGQHPNTVIITKIDTIILAKIDRMLGETATINKSLQVSAPIQAVAPIPASAPFNPSAPANGQA